MNKEFVPYEQALALKELGFDELCLMYFSDKSKELLSLSERDVSFFQGTSNSTFTKAPLFQQAFRWLYQKLEINGVMPLDEESQIILLKELIASNL